MLIIVLLFSGCAKSQACYYETVCDVLPAGDPSDAPYEIRFEVPPDAIPAAQTQALTVYEAPDGAYTVTARILVTDGLDAAVYALCGFAQPHLDLSTKDAQECRVAWREEDGAVNRALIRRSGDYCYILCLRLRAGLSGEYNDMINGLFSSFALVERVR